MLEAFKRNIFSFKEWFNKQKILKSLIVSCIIAIISAFVAGRLTNWWSGPKSYVIFVIGNDNSNTIKKIKEGFNEEYNLKNLEIDGVKVKVKSIDDKGDLYYVNEIAARIAKRNDTLFVIGHFSSTLNKSALPYYVQANPPIPVIMVSATNPNIVPPVSSEIEVYPIFRLSPSDDVQAKEAATFAINCLNCQSFWVVEDISNNIYSKYLSTKFIEKVQEEKKRIILWSNNISTPSAYTFAILKIDCVFFSGSWSNSIILINQVNEIYTGRNSPSIEKKRPEIILSDWSASNNLISHGGDAVKDVYVLYPMDANKYNTVGHKIKGKSTYCIVDKLINDANDDFSSLIKKEKGMIFFFLKRLLNIHKVEDARSVINSTMKKAMLFRDTFYGKEREEYSFTAEYKNDKGRFHIWKISGENDDEIRFKEIEPTCNKNKK